MKISSKHSLATLRVAGVAFLMGATAMMTGCGAGMADMATTTSAASATELAGKMYGGTTPIVGAKVYVLAANSNGYYNNTPGVGASISLLTANIAGTDAVGGYVTTDSAGSFHIPAGSYTCTSGQQVYLLTSGGNPGGGTNAALSLMALLGDCPAAGNFAAAVPFVWINEVSTVAAAYATAGFAIDTTHIGSATSAQSKAQMKNAFAMAANLVNIANGNALATTPAGNGVVPQALINTLANIMVSCVNSTGAASGPCTTFFTNAQGTMSAAPTDTANAMINIAHTPFNNVTNLYNLQTGQTAFNPALSSAPADFTMPLVYTVPTAGGSVLAIDGVGNVWYGSSDGNNLSEVSPTGAVLVTGTPLWTSGGTTSLAIDSQNAVWAVNHDSAQFAKVSSTGAIAIPAVKLPDPFTLSTGAVDASDNFWLEASSASQKLYEFNSSGTQIAGPFVMPIPLMTGLAFDRSGNLWIGSGNSGNGLISDTSGNTVASFSSPISTQSLALDNTDRGIYASNLSSSMVNATLSGSTVFTGTFSGGASNPSSIAIDGSGLIWYSMVGGGLSAYTSGGAVVGPTAGFSTSKTFLSTATDGAGNLWVGGNDLTTLTEFIGLVTPTATPINGATHGLRP